MQNIDWVKEFPASITVCDIEGVILYMNDLAIEVFKDDGGVSLIGTNLLECHPEPSRTKLKNMGGGYLNHNIYWSNLNPNNTKDKNLIKKINRDFGSIKKFKEQFTQLAITLFGSGWVWLVEKSDGKLDIYQLPNQDSPLTLGHKPILALDVWEHAYYLKYKNKRIDYINAWWNLIKLI